MSSKFLCIYAFITLILLGCHISKTETNNVFTYADQISYVLKFLLLYK